MFIRIIHESPFGNMRKRRDPTMERSQMEEKESERIKLHQRFMHLQQDWDSFKQANPRTLRRCSTDTATMVKTLQLMDNSPRSLMSCLQHRKSPSEGGWNVRNNDFAVEEIRRERRAAIESGKLKGRRLLEVLERATEMGLGGRQEISIGCSDLIQESEVRSASSYASGDEIGNGGSRDEQAPVCCHSSCSSSSVSDEKLEREKVVAEGEVVVTKVEESKAVDDNGGRWMILMGWVAIVLMVFTLSIISTRSFDGYDGQDEVILVPT